MRESTEQGHVIAWMVEKRYSLIVLLSLVATAWVFPYLLHAQEAVTQPKLNSILDSLERTGEQNPALSRPYQVTREYKVFRSEDPKPMSDVTAQISFIPPDTKTFKITDAQGSPRGIKIVSAILEHEIASAKEGHQRDISRSNYKFVFLREQNFGVVPEYVLHIIPKRKEKGLLLGDIWVDAKTHRIRQIIGVPLKTPSFWIKRPPHHRAIRRRERHVDTRFCGRHCHGSVSGHLLPFRSQFGTTNRCFKPAKPLITVSHATLPIYRGLLRLGTVDDEFDKSNQARTRSGKSYAVWTLVRDIRR